MIKIEKKIVKKRYYLDLLNEGSRRGGLGQGDDFENFISTADLVLIQTETKYFITTSVQKYKMIFDISHHIRLHVRTEMSEQRH